MAKKRIAYVIRESAFFRIKYIVKGPEWTVLGDAFDRDYYNINSENGQRIAFVCKDWTILGNTYSVAIDDSIDEGLAIAVITIVAPISLRERIREFI